MGKVSTLGHGGQKGWSDEWRDNAFNILCLLKLKANLVGESALDLVLHGRELLHLDGGLDLRLGQRERDCLDCACVVNNE